MPVGKCFARATAPAAVPLLTLMERRMTAGVASQEPDRHCGRAPSDKGRTRTCNSGRSAAAAAAAQRGIPLRHQFKGVARTLRPLYRPLACLPGRICFPRAPLHSQLSCGSLRFAPFAAIGCYPDPLLRRILLTVVALIDHRSSPPARPIDSCVPVSGVVFPASPLAVT